MFRRLWKFLTKTIKLVDKEGGSNAIDYAPEAEKKRIFDFSNFFSSQRAIPERCVYSDPAVEYHQGNTKRCTGYSGTAVFNLLQKKDVGFNPGFNPDLVWAKQTQLHPKTGSDNTGDYVVAPYQMFEKLGMDYPAKDGLHTFKLKNYYQIPCRDLDSIRIALAEHGPLGMGGKFNTAIFDDVRNTGYMKRTLSDTGASTFGHALALIGYDNNKGEFVIQDSYKGRKNNIFSIKYDTWLKGCNDGTIFASVIVPVDISDKEKFQAEVEYALFDDVGVGLKEQEPEIYDAIAFCKDAGIFQGGNGKFFPEDSISRKHVAVVIKRLIDYIQDEGKAKSWGEIEKEDSKEKTKK